MSPEKWKFILTINQEIKMACEEKTNDVMEEKRSWKKVKNGVLQTADVVSGKRKLAPRKPWNTNEILRVE